MKILMEKLKKQTEISRLKKKEGITLIALVITIIILLILAGVSIGLVFNSEGLFKKSSGAAEKYNESKAREVLETVLMGHASIQKYTNSDYNQDFFLDNIILKEIPQSKVQGDIAIVDGYAYELDRSVPKIGRYLGKEEELIFPEVSISTPILASDSRTSTFIITAREQEHGISKIEVLQYEQVVQKFTYSNETNTITQEITVKKNGTYTVKAYSDLTGAARTEVTGIVMSVEFSPNGDTTYKKEHLTKIIVQETGERVKSLKYQWTKSAVEPSETSFEDAKEVSNGSTITGKGNDMTGTYFLWVLLETDTGKKNICGSNEFNFDNTGPTATKFEGEKLSLNSIKVSYKISEELSKIQKIDIYVDGSYDNTINECVNLNIFEGEYIKESIDTGNHLIKFVMYDTLNNATEVENTFSTKLYAWACYTHNWWQAYKSSGAFSSVRSYSSYDYRKFGESLRGIYLFSDFPSWSSTNLNDSPVNSNGVYHDYCTYGELCDILNARNLQICNAWRPI